MGLQQRHHLLPELVIPGADQVQIGGLLIGRGELQGVGENLALVHGISPPDTQCAVRRRNPRTDFQVFSISRFSQALA